MNAIIQHTAALEFMKQLPWGQFQSVLDIGCGDGFAAREFLKRDLTVRAVDRCRPAAPDIAAVWAEAVDAHKLPFSNHTWDAVWSHHCLEHLESPLNALIE